MTLTSKNKYCKEISYILYNKHPFLPLNGNELYDRTQKYSTIKHYIDMFTEQV